jgi:hypothetical protein
LDDCPSCKTNVGNETVLSEIIVLITTVLFGEIDGDWMKKKKN